MKNLDNFERVFAESNDDGNTLSQEFTVVVDKILTGESLAGNPKFTWKLIVQGGLYDGIVIYKNNTLSSSSSVIVFKRDLSTCQFYPSSLNDAFENHESLLGCRLRVKQVTKNGFTSVYFQELLSPGSEEDVSSYSDGEVDGHPEA